MAMPITNVYTVAGGTGSKTPVSLDHYMLPFNVGYIVIVPGGTTFSGTVDHTYDDLNMVGLNGVPLISIANANWQSSAAITTTTEGTFTVPFPFIRLTINTLTGTGPITFKITQGFSVL